jgi:hypothetical protein
MKTKAIAGLIADLSQLIAPLEGKTIEEYKKLSVLAEKTIKLIHGKRSHNVLGYRDLPIETELSHKFNDIRVHMLEKMLEGEASYKRSGLPRCWEDFTIATKLNFGEHRADGSGWDNGDLARKAQNMLFEIVLEKLTEQFESKKLAGAERKEALELLNGLKARYNSGHKQYQIAHELLKKFDINKEVIDTMQYA